MDVVLPEEGTSGASATDSDLTAAETIDGQTQTSQRQTGERRESENLEVDQNEPSEVKASSEGTTSHQSNGKHASAVRKPRTRTKGLVKNLQEQVRIEYLL